MRRYVDQICLPRREEAFAKDGKQSGNNVQGSTLHLCLY